MEKKEENIGQEQQIGKKDFAGKLSNSTVEKNKHKKKIER